MKRRYQGNWNVNMIADFCWMLKGESVEDSIMGLLWDFSDIEKCTALHFHSSVASTRKLSRIYSKMGLPQVCSVDTEID